MQVDLGNERVVHAVATQGYSSSTYTLSTYTLSCSVDGNSFTTVKNGTSTMVSLTNIISAGPL